MRPLTRDLRNGRVIVLKGILFVVAGVIATAIVVMDVASGATAPWWRTIAMHVLAIWCFCRAYYFAFYVIERYVDAEYRYAGLWSAVRWMAAPRGAKASGGRGGGRAGGHP